ncbi:LysR family transcriptional regulator [Alginatibacterium sediminis]|uniref:LysR family transcriptional regulator n=1 Tax=Alginatibacterium sediminis TaxID=2164068 RepID=A0A420EL10_9ALTE|nr:LysR family transcriptional regulator [Alginatibacterium sediminis]RKF21387.1 LysR family transcriptional regulator [Alginatibacterium sediminis]
MTLKQLQHFLAVQRHASFTLAAREQSIAQPALSISIKNLERQLGVKLFLRHDRNVILSDEGKVLFSYAANIVQQLEDAQLAMSELKGLVKGEVRLGTPSMMGSYFFPDIIMAFKQRYPKLKLTVVDAGTQSIREMLLSAELDVGVILNQNVPPALETQLLLSSQMVAVFSPQHPLAKQALVNFEQFFENDLVMFKPGYFHRDFIDAACEAHNLSARFAFETNLLTMILKIVGQNFATTALLEIVTQNEDSVVGVPFNPAVHLDLALAWRKEGYLSIAERCFIDFVNEYMNSRGDTSL